MDEPAEYPLIDIINTIHIPTSYPFIHRNPLKDGF
jgi:hypothetical protein